jgi:uncharacterized damage-inducible protein DinB
MYVKSVIHQLRFSVESVLQLINRIEPVDLDFRIHEEKKSIGELVQHLSELIEADLLISKGTSQEEMNLYYESNKCHSIEDMKNLLKKGFSYLESVYLIMNEEELKEEIESYWGVKYSRFEWLLEILVHFTHHRAQLHMLMVQKYKNVNVSLFE